ncbi:MAG TPA: DUF2058 family protein [Arenimonas sp.]|nr:DUF2058 family protein [Arenimonas sp.]HPW31786.1 DUF2058 family protein [Arenimonas sp.]
MSNSLRDQLLGLGFKTAPKPEKKPEPQRPAKPSSKPEHKQHQGQRANPRQAQRPSQQTKPASKSQEEIDLAKAYALRSETEKQERIAAEKRKQEEAKLKRELKQRVQELLKDKAQNIESAEHVRHFEYNGKIRRVYVTPEQLSDLNKGVLGLVQLDGRYLIVNADIADQVKLLLPSIVALQIDPNAPASDDPYSDPLYQVPDDLVW